MVSVTMSARGLPGLGHEEARGAAWAGVESPTGRTARGRPPSPLIGAGYVWAFQLVVFGSAVLQSWACG